MPTYKVPGYDGNGALVALPVVDFLTPQPSTAELGVKRSVSFEVDWTDMEAQENVQLGPTLPAGAVVTHSAYHVNTTFQSATDAATIGIGFNTDAANGIESSAAISAGGNKWDAGWFQGAQDGTVATGFIPTAGLTAARKVEFTRAGGEDLTAGNLTLFLEYVVL